MVTGAKRPFVPITEIEHSAFCRPEDELKAKALAEELKVNVRWQRIPTDYLHLSAEELDQRIGRVRQELGSKVTILGHHYQREEVIKYADYQGDSFKLSRDAASHPESDYIVFCGVHFMAETAGVLCGPHQKVILPNLAAGCSMADMAPMHDVLDAWDDLIELLGDDGIIPMAYMNTIAGLKALCGRHGGIICTSANAVAALEWSYRRSPRVLFLPDQHLGRNTGLKLGLDLEEMVTWNPFKPLGGNTPERLEKAKLILWQGHCSVHTRFTTRQIEAARQRFPDVKIIAHPECTMEVVQAADMDGSTEVIRRVISEAPAGSVWGVGTEISLVNRLAKQNPDKTVFCLDPVVCPCSTMYRIHPAYLLWVLEGLAEGVVVNQIVVDDETRHYSRIALERMLQVV
ncbi:MAG: quinolinate synthase NadA [Dehalococcoidia bacterium]|nr:quinolinate synthase NadA [Dehalococcoidia bacterium]